MFALLGLVQRTLHDIAPLYAARGPAVRGRTNDLRGGGGRSRSAARARSCRTCDDVAAAEASLRAGFAGVDVVLTHPIFGMVSIPVARSMGVPVVAGQLYPMMIPTRAWTPPLGTRNLRLPTPLNRLAWWALRRGTGLTMRDDRTNEMRRRLGQGPIRGAAGFTWLEADRTVLLASRHYYGDSPPDWPSLEWCGFARWNGPPGQQLDDDLTGFLDEDPPPVLVTLGTSAAARAADRFGQLRDGLTAIGQRSVLLVGPTVDVGPLADEPGVVPFAPMSLVLPRCAVAVVSGALGGMAAAMHAGVPIVVHPQLVDQLWNGGRVEQLGVGLLARRTSQVPAAVARVLADPSFQQRAAALATQLAIEDGADACTNVIESLI